MNIYRFNRLLRHSASFKKVKVRQTQGKHKHMHMISTWIVIVIFGSSYYELVSFSLNCGIDLCVVALTRVNPCTDESKTAATSKMERFVIIVNV